MNKQNGSKLNQQITINSSLPAQLTTVKTDEQTPLPKSNLNGKGRFDQPVILRQSHNWSRAILWTIMGVTTFGMIWASVAKIEEAVPAQGKLEPQGAVKEVQAPVNGVVKEINVTDGQHVKKGDLLIRLDSTAAKAQQTSQEKIRATLIKENQFYRAVLSNSTFPSVTKSELIQLELPREIAALAETRKAFLAENELYRTQLGDSTGANLSPEERKRFGYAKAELDSRVNAAKSEVDQLKKRREQNRVQLANSRSRFRVEQGILNEIEPLAVQGAVPKVQYLRQQQEVKTRQSEVAQQEQEDVRLDLDIAKAEQQLENTKALSQKDLTTQIAANDKKIAEIDSQFNKVLIENEKKIAEIDSQLSQINLNLSYQELRAPTDGTVFDLKPTTSGFVTNSTEPILKIVPDDGLVAKVFITNKDIGFVKEGMPVDVRIDSFPFSEFGDVKGELVWIGSDALPPEQVRPFYSFPAKIRLNRQAIAINERNVPLQSGMSISANIRVRDRTVLSIFTDLFTSKTESLKNVR
jgi:HlyD family type I secretion membrane fusion protein